MTPVPQPFWVFGRPWSLFSPESCTRLPEPIYGLLEDDLGRSPHPPEPQRSC
jgi:hypothetical protein